MLNSTRRLWNKWIVGGVAPIVTILAFLIYFLSSGRFPSLVKVLRRLAGVLTMHWVILVLAVFAMLILELHLKYYRLKRYATPNVEGTWAWECGAGKHPGELTLTQKDNEVRGSFHDGGEIKGTIAGNVVIFTRASRARQQRYTLTLSTDGKTLKGFFEGYGDNSAGKEFTAERKC